MTPLRKPKAAAAAAMLASLAWGCGDGGAPPDLEPDIHHDAALLCGDEACPEGWVCLLDAEDSGEPVDLCVPADALTCRPCRTDDDCVHMDAAYGACVQLGDHSSCLMACPDEGCPAGTECVPGTEPDQPDLCEPENGCTGTGDGDPADGSPGDGDPADGSPGDGGAPVPDGPPGLCVLSGAAGSVHACRLHLAAESAASPLATAV